MSQQKLLKSQIQTGGDFFSTKNQETASRSGSCGSEIQLNFGRSCQGKSYPGKCSLSQGRNEYIKVQPVIEQSGIRLKIGSMNNKYEIFLPNITDPSELRSDVQGKLVRFLVSEGDIVEDGQVVQELEAMKMIVPVKIR